MINDTNCIGAIVVLHKSRSVRNGVPCVITDYSKGDAGTNYKKYINVYFKEDNSFNWVQYSTIKKVLKYGAKLLDTDNTALLLKQINMLTR